jgi:hypothetical protein
MGQFGMIVEPQPVKFLKWEWSLYICMPLAFQCIAFLTKYCTVYSRYPQQPKHSPYHCYDISQKHPQKSVAAPSVQDAFWLRLLRIYSAPSLDTVYDLNALGRIL